MDLKKIPQQKNNLIFRREDRGWVLYDNNSKRKFFISDTAGKIFKLCNGKNNFLEIISKFSGSNKKDLIDFFEDLIQADLIEIDGKIKKSKYFKNYPYSVSNITTPLSAPLHIYWELTYDCNLNCKHCYVKDRKLSSQELDINKCFKIIDQLSKLKIFEITFSGGEPLMKKGIIDLINYTTKKGITSLITTNGTLITRDIAKKLKDAGLQAAQVSLDSTEEKIHDEFRGVSGAFNSVLNGIKNLLEFNIPVVLATVPTRKNIKQIDKLIKLARKLGVQGYRILECKPFGRGGNISDEMISFDEYKGLLQKISKERKRNGMFIILSESFAFLINKDFKKNLISPLIDCPAGRSMLSITPDGLVAPCSYFAFADLTIGDLKKEKISDIWQSSTLLKELRSINFSNKEDSNKTCDSCSYSKFCGRGCRALAYKASGNLRGLDPRCLSFKK